ncbi:OmpA family protein [Collimonas silvisoli]|uniref:OmpA family protein n=1 Tax=Collimonas silvisoli TaxID=2825884 RepID=UPI001B8BA99E|nr:OmpA family protein [Collimonas silvisoli]
MKNRHIAVLFGLLIAATLVRADDAVEFPDRSKAWLKEGTFVNLDNLRQMMPGLSKSQVSALLEKPHFSEGIFHVRKWNYIFNFRTGKGNEFITCQYQIRYDDKLLVQSVHWKERECEALVAPAPERAGPIGSEHFAVNEDVLFAFDKSSVNDMLPDGRAALNDIAARLNSAYRKLTSIKIIGHTDRIGPGAYNQELSLARALTVRDYLVSRGLPSNPLAATGVGNAEPVASGCPAGRSSEAVRCLQPDRRVTIDVLGEKRQ